MQPTGVTLDPALPTEHTHELRHCRRSSPEWSTVELSKRDEARKGSKREKPRCFPPSDLTSERSGITSHTCFATGGLPEQGDTGESISLSQRLAESEVGNSEGPPAAEVISSEERSPRGSEDQQNAEQYKRAYLLCSPGPPSTIIPRYSIKRETTPPPP